MAAANTQDGVSDDLNYETWAPTAKSTLVEKGLWDVVENGLPPNPTKNLELAATIKVADLAQWRNRVMRDIKALKIMQSSLPDSSFRKTIAAASAKELWDSLERGNEEAKLRRLENQFEELSMCEKESIKSYFARVTRIVEQLRVLKNEKSDYEVVKKVLASLSGSYKEAAPLIGELMDLKEMTLESLAGVFRTFDSISDEDVHRMLKLNRLKFYSGTGKWCDVCDKEDHDVEECHSTIPKEGDWSIKQGIYGRRCFRRAGTEHGEELFVDYILLAKLELGAFTYDEDTWMIYGHATCNMTPHEKLFTRLDRRQKAKVGLVDGTVIMAEGSGDVKIVMKDGKKKTIRDVLFVPRGINRNVLSVPMMTSRGCSFESGERGECVVRDKTGAVFGDTTWDERGLSIRMQVVKADLSA
ncbi:uncharacterized protein LOC108858151 [Raphanus sativus]|uniref:Uncharacterized protein LOC108858151 n=1 Tax=Raphanus sativus TaxID=3726 RepID=A0A6J0NU21_RAPSA|nr:uncharacterized protein LOC108858151 [Raphanus sativus]